MPVAIALTFGVVLLAVCLIGIFWTLVFLVPFYAYVGAAVYLIWRSRREESALAESFEREAERQRQFNDQEMRAWRSSLESNQRNNSKREKALRNFDKSRDPPP
jgi:hypothetical protein